MSKPEFDHNRCNEKRWAKQNYIQLSGMRELYDLVDDVTNRLKINFGIVANSGKMKWERPEEKAMACKVIYFKDKNQIHVIEKKKEDVFYIL